MLTVISSLIRLVSSRILIWLGRPLVDRGFGLVYDVERDLTWLKDTNYAKTVGRSPDGQLTWYQATAWVKGMSYFGIREWRLPSALNEDGSGPCIGHGCNRSEIGHLLTLTTTVRPAIDFEHFQNNAKYWNSTEASETDAYGWDFFSLKQGTLAKDISSDPLATLTGPILSWPVHDGDAASQVFSRFFAFALRPVRWGARIDES